MRVLFCFFKYGGELSESFCLCNTAGGAPVSPLNQRVGSGCQENAYHLCASCMGGIDESCAAIAAKSINLCAVCQQGFYDGNIAGVGCKHQRCAPGGGFGVSFGSCL